METTKLEKQIEAILFFKGERMKRKVIAKILNASTEEIDSALLVLEKNLEGRGVCLLIKDDEVGLGTSPEMSELITSVRKEELSRDIGKAGLETLSIILYKGPIARSEIDYIRGVNSSFIIRNLLIRALIERESNPNDSRSFLYKPTFELFSFLGITKIEDLPEFEKVQTELQNFIESREGIEGTENSSFAEEISQQ